MFAKRYGEENSPPFRSQRLFSENGQWFFDTREGQHMGPYRDLKEVKKALSLFLAQRLLLARNKRGWNEPYLPGSQDGVEDMVAEVYDYLIEYTSRGQTAAAIWANQRLRELLRSNETPVVRSARIDAIRYALDLDAEWN